MYDLNYPRDAGKDEEHEKTKKKKNPDTRGLIRRRRKRRARQVGRGNERNVISPTKKQREQKHDGDMGEQAAHENRKQQEQQQ